MKLKTIVGIVGTVAVGVVVAGAIAIQSINLDDARALIIGQVKSLTGRDLRIDGDLRVALSLRPSLQVEGITLTNATWGSRAELMKLDHLDVQVELWPLMSGDIRVRRLRLVGADIVLETDKSGLGNWEFDVGTADSAAESANGDEGSGRALPFVNKVDIVDSVIVFRDGVSGDTRRMDIAALQVATSGPSQPFHLELNGKMDGQAVEIAGQFGDLAGLLNGGVLPVDLAGKVGNSKLAVVGSLTQPLDHKDFALNVSASGENLAEFGELIREDLPAWRNYSIAFKLSEKSGVLVVDGVRATVGRSDASGHLELATDQEPTRLTGTFTSTMIDLSDLDESREGTERGGNDGRIFSDKPLPYAWQRKLDGVLTLRVGRLVKRAAVFTDVEVDSSLANGRFELTRAKAAVGGGTVTLSAVIDASGKSPAMTLKGEARQVEAGMVLQMLDLSDVLRGGKADVTVDVSGRGMSLHEIMADLAGTARWSQVGGTIDDGFARILLADISGLLRTGSGGGQLTCLAGGFTAKGGIASTRGLVVDTPAASIFGTGSVNLGLETIKMRFDPAAKETSLAALAVPVDVTGPLANPSVTPDPLGVAKTAVGAASTVVGDVFDVLDQVVGSGEGGGTDSPCVMALDASAKSKPAKQKSMGEQFLDDTGDVIEDIGKGIGDLFD
ncbi:MAG: AsmA family protein [Dongiaceae bacterium]